MELEEAITILENHNQWRRNNEIPNTIAMVNPKTLGIAIDTVVECRSKMNNERIIVKWWRFKCRSKMNNERVKWWRVKLVIYKY